MWVWILSAMDLSAKIALGSLFWLIAICIVAGVIGLIGYFIDKAWEG